MRSRRHTTSGISCPSGKGTQVTFAPARSSASRSASPAANDRSGSACPWLTSDGQPGERPLGESGSHSSKAMRDADNSAIASRAKPRAQERVAGEHAALREAAGDERPRARRRLRRLEERRAACSRAAGRSGGCCSAKSRGPRAMRLVAQLGVDVPPRPPARLGDERRLGKEEPAPARESSARTATGRPAPSESRARAPRPRAPSSRSPTEIGAQAAEVDRLFGLTPPPSAPPPLDGEVALEREEVLLEQVIRQRCAPA